MSDEKLDLIGIVSLGQIKAVRQLIEQKNSGKIKLDINERDEEGNFAAIVAVQRNDLPMLELLVSNGARIDLPDGYGNTVEWWAKRYNNEKMLQLVKRVSETENSSVNEHPSKSALQNGNGHINHVSIRTGGGK